MSRPSNKEIDVFKYVNMTTGPEFVDPDTKAISRCWPFTGALNNEGRPYFQVSGKKHLAYRLVWKLVRGEDLGNRMFRHKCDNPVCCNPDHGIAGSHQENMDDMKERERHGLSHHMVRAIRRMLDSGKTITEVAEFTQLSRKTISDIRDKKNYSHVKD